MKRTAIIYTLLLASFVFVFAFAIYFYNQVQSYDAKIKKNADTSSPSAYHFALIGEEMDHVYWRLVGEGAKEKEGEYDVFVEYEGPKRSNPEEQLKLLDMAVKSKVDGIIVQALNDKFTPLINQAVDQGIPVMTVDTDAPESRRVAYIGTDNYEAGRLAGETLVKDTKGKATVGIITGRFANAHHQLRIEGFKDVLKQTDGIEIVAVEESNIDRIGAEEQAYKMLREHPDITAFYGTSTLDGGGITAAAEKLNRLDDLYVITFDLSDENAQLLQNGAIDALVEQQPYQMGSRSVEIMMDIIKGKPVEEIHHTDATIIRKPDLLYQKSQAGETS
ncbi:sugar-binding protein [Lederbergia galactosidilytica]|uniref:LacI family transcriptional regulator n=1 Tax=Lederbergia galactosidilytica TaxID=217031 RepID=A0A178A1J2_9BACI|nr:sugar-binding protein [Lederbergia galactosidilytica]KRG12272.1 LacI family transcriptional regulator [Virgibacillus soli]OAK73964.1 LacI family transcriptional regulator [Lederbergia galactosidilytica]